MVAAVPDEKKAYVKDIHVTFGCYYNPTACSSLVLVGGFSISQVWSSGRNCVWRFNLYEELICAISCSIVPLLSHLCL